MSVTLGFMRAPRKAKVAIRVEVTADVRIAADDARELADEFLLMEVGDLVSAGEPSLQVANRLAWEIPIVLSNATRGVVGEVGRLLVDAETGEIQFTEEQVREAKAHAKVLSGRAAPPTSC